MQASLYTPVRSTFISLDSIKFTRQKRPRSTALYYFPTVVHALYFLHSYCLFFIANNCYFPCISILQFTCEIVFFSFDIDKKAFETL